MKFEIIGEPVKVGKEGMIHIPFELSSMITQNEKAKILDSGKDFVIITAPDNSSYDGFFSRRLTKLNKVCAASVWLWRLCKENYIAAGEYLYAHKLAQDAVLITVKPVLWIEVENL